MTSFDAMPGPASRMTYRPRLIVALPEEELDRIYRVCRPEYRRVWAQNEWQAIFSCNAKFEAWPTPGLGRTPEHARELLDLEDFPHLWQIVLEVLKINPLGGRIFVKNDEFYVTRGENKERLPVGVIRRATVAPRARARSG